MRDDQVAAAVIEEKPWRSAAGARQSRAAWIEGTYPVDEAIGGEVRVAADDDVGAAAGGQWPQLLVIDAWIDSRAVVGLGCGMDAKDGGAGKLQAQLGGQAVQDAEQASLIQDPAGSPDSCCHGRVAFHQVRVPGRVGGGRVRRWLLARQDVTVSIPAQRPW